jgi:hypothetical protein
VFSAPDYGVLFPVLVLGSAVSCADPGRATGVYTHDTRVLVRVDYDYDGNGLIDVRTYMRGGRPVRLEGDANGDGRIDRWEYYGAGGELLRIGASTLADGREDTWVVLAGAHGAQADERRVDLSTRRDNTIDRRETYRGDTLVRAASDTNHDGLPDTWEEYSGGTLVRLLIDDDRRHGRPTRRIRYGPGGAAHVDALDPADDKETDDARR